MLHFGPIFRALSFPADVVKLITSQGQKRRAPHSLSSKAFMRCTSCYVTFSTVRIHTRLLLNRGALHTYPSRPKALAILMTRL